MNTCYNYCGLSNSFAENLAVVDGAVNKDSSSKPDRNFVRKAIEHSAKPTLQHPEANLNHIVNGIVR